MTANSIIDMKAKLIKNHYGFEYFLADENGSAIATSNDGKLSKQNCDEIFGVVDVESLALSKASFFGGTYRNPEGFSDEQVGYLHGFIEAMELNEDKLFTEDDVITAIVHYTYLLHNDGKGYEEGDNNDDRIECVIAALKQKPIEIEVEIEMVKVVDKTKMIGAVKGVKGSGHKIKTYKSVPNLDSDECLILKKI
jgi:hypothetical protein